MSGSTLQRLRAGGPRLTVGMITADLLHLGDELALLETAGAELVHVDVMDGVFCPMLTVGPPVIKTMRTELLKDAHLMIDDPLTKVDAFVAAGADMITFQVEGAPQPHQVLQALGKATNVNDPARGIVRGVAVNPSTPLEVLRRCWTRSTTSSCLPSTRAGVGSRSSRRPRDAWSGCDGWSRTPATGSWSAWTAP
jgi:ribulose-phosphate 3-epimerase